MRENKFRGRPFWGASPAPDEDVTYKHGSAAVWPQDLATQGERVTRGGESRQVAAAGVGGRVRRDRRDGAVMDTGIDTTTRISTPARR